MKKGGTSEKSRLTIKQNKFKYYRAIFPEAGTLRCMGIAMLISIIMLLNLMLPVIEKTPFLCIFQHCSRAKAHCQLFFV